MTENPIWYQKVSQKTKLHFDKKKSYIKAANIIKKENVAKHRFFPFIFFQIKAFRYFLLKKKKKNNENYVHDELFKVRDINYACYSDSYIFAYYNEILSQIYESKLTELNLSAPIAYRSIKTKNNKGKNNINFAAEVFYEIKQRKDCYCIAIDIRSFFDNLDHQILKQALIKILNQENCLEKDWYTVYRNLTKFHYIELKKLLKILKKKKSDFWKKGFGFEKICTPEELRELIKKHKDLVKTNKFIKNKKGIPQGTNISGLLANIYMLDFDFEIENYMNILGGYYRRYSDDILIILNKEDDLIKILSFVESLLKKYKLEEAEEKRCISKFQNGICCKYKDNITPLQYLGFIYDGKNIRVRNATIGKFWRDAKPHIKRMIITSLKNKQKIPMGKIYGLYSHLKNRKKHIKKNVAKSFSGNFYQYIRNADKIFKEEYGFSSEVKIKKQMKNSWRLLNSYIDKTVLEYYIQN